MSWRESSPHLFQKRESHVLWLETVTSNLHRQAGQATQGYNVQGSTSLQITLK
jgi:hypothetical protein